MKHPSFTSSFRTLLITDRLLAFVLYAVLFVAVVVGIDHALMLLRPPGNSVFAYATADKQRQLENRMDAGLDGISTVTIGSSRAQFAFAPDAFAKDTRSYNAGVGGFIRTDQHYDLLRRVMGRGNPKRIVYVVDDIDLNAEPRGNRSQQLVRSFRSVRLLRRGLNNAIMAMADDGWRIPAFKKIKLKLKPFQKYEGYKVHDDGWVEGMGTANTSVVRHKKIKFLPNKDAILYLRLFIEFCRERSIPLVLVQAPLHAEYLKAGAKRIGKFRAFIKGLAAEYDVQFFDFADPALFPVGDAEMFFDTSHLNSRGARLFSQRLGERIKQRSGSGKTQ